MVILVSLAFAVEGVDGAGLMGKVVHGREDGEEDTGGEEGYGRPYLGRREGTRGSSPLERHACHKAHPLSPRSDAVVLLPAADPCPFVALPPTQSIL